MFGVNVPEHPILDVPLVVRQYVQVRSPQVRRFGRGASFFSTVDK